MVRWAALAQHDDRAARTLTRLRERYGPDPLPLRIPGRTLALVLHPDDVARVLEESPDPFSPATREKVAALRHFEPHVVLISSPAQRPPRRAFHEDALETSRPTHDAAAPVRSAVEREAAPLLRGIERGGVLTWDRFATSA